MKLQKITQLLMLTVGMQSFVYGMVDPIDQEIDRKVTQDLTLTIKKYKKLEQKEDFKKEINKSIDRIKNLYNGGFLDEYHYAIDLIDAYASYFNKQEYEEFSKNAKHAFETSKEKYDKNEQLYWEEKELEWQKQWQLFRLKAGFSFGVGCLLVAGILGYAYKKYCAYQEKKKQAQVMATNKN